MKPLPVEFYLQEDVVQIAKNLLGKYLITSLDGEITGGMITETEAYKGPEDRASHAYNNRYTERTKVMFEEGGVAYVYLCYGLHNLFNVVTNKEGTPHAVLIRALKPEIGIEIMERRRGTKNKKILCKGPGSVCQALGINRILNGHSLQDAPLWIEDRGVKVKEKEIKATPRIGVAYAKEDALLPWRFEVRA